MQPLYALYQFSCLQLYAGGPKNDYYNRETSLLFHQLSILIQWFNTILLHDSFV